jgi:hypothetical protein
MKSKSNNTFYIVLIVIISVVTLGLVTLLIVGIANKGFGFNSDNVSENLVLEQEYALEDLQKIDATVKAGKLTVYSTQEDVAKVKFYAEKSSAADVVKSGDMLKISDRSDECHFICFNWRGVNVEIYLPDSYDGTIKLDVDAGRMTVGDFRLASVDIKNDMGDVELGTAKNINADVDMGKLIVADCLGKLTLKNDMGDIEVRSLHLTEDSEIKLDMGNVTIDSVGDVRVDSDVELGNSNISGGNHKSDIVLKIRNSMGNVTVR